MTINESTSHFIKAEIFKSLNEYKSRVKKMAKKNRESAFLQYVVKLLDMDSDEISQIKFPSIPTLPPGAPIGSCSLD